MNVKKPKKYRKVCFYFSIIGIFRFS